MEFLALGVAKDRVVFFLSSENGFITKDLRPYAVTWLLDTSNFRSSCKELRSQPPAVLCVLPSATVLGHCRWSAASRSFLLYNQEVHFFPLRVG